MGTFTITIAVAGQGEYTERLANVPVLVDTGAAHTWLPSDLLDYLGVGREWQQRFVLANQDTEERDMGYAFIGIEDQARRCPVVFGPYEEGGLDYQGLLGATTLEVFSLGVDPVNQRLVPMIPRGRPI